MSVALIWLRQDLRCFDNAALALASRSHQHIIVVYLFDEETRRKGAAQKWWLYHSLRDLSQALLAFGLPISFRSGDALTELSRLVREFRVDAVYWNRCYEPQLIKRDTVIKQALKQQGVDVFSAPGNLLFEPWTVHNQQGGYFKVFTPFWKQCLKQCSAPKRVEPVATCLGLAVESEALDSWNLLPTAPNWALPFSDYWSPGEAGARKQLTQFIQTHLEAYHSERDIPFRDATSKLSPHLHFGEIIVWDVWRAIVDVKKDANYNTVSVDRFLSELGWREFSYHLLYHFPELPDTNFKQVFNAFPWVSDNEALLRWQKGLTGFPIVDAGMRELWNTGYMHNRVRMIVASFLTKDLSIDWRQGAAWFWDTLLDADLANNSASWQWVAGCGADAAPYFRIFNPVLQGEKFDPLGEYVKCWVPELVSVSPKWIHQPWVAPKGALSIQLGQDYPYPMVDHSVARQHALALYAGIK